MRFTISFLAFLVLASIVLAPLCSQTTCLVEADTAQPPFKIKHRMLFSTDPEYPSVWVFAAITNEGTDPVTNVSATITFWDNTGMIINQTVQKTILQVILPNRTSPVFASITDSDAVRYGDSGRYDVNITAYDVYPEGRELGLVVNPTATYLTDTGSYIQGTVMNNGSGVVQFIQVTAMFYDENGFRNSESAQISQQGGLTQGQVTDFEITTVFATNLSRKVACVITAESPQRTGQAAYEIDQEVLIWLKGGPETEGPSFDLRWIVLIAVLVIVVLAGVTMVRRRWQNKTRRPKETVIKARMLKPTGFYFATITVLRRYVKSAYLGLRGLGCKAFGWSVTILGTA